jgi:5'-3' exonuclease
VISSGQSGRDVTDIKYKANRKTAKPEFYLEGRKYLIDNYNAVGISGLEADDICNSLAVIHKDATIAHIDKDLDMIPGSHYNYIKNISYEVTEKDAKLHKLKMLLKGDSADNILTLRGIGEKKADKIINASPHLITVARVYKNGYEKIEGFGNEWKIKLKTVIDLITLQSHDVEFLLFNEVSDIKKEEEYILNF